jgi:acetyltransferase-like isoleucine patch superfamily enzyme
MSYFQRIEKALKKLIESGKKDFVIYPFGEQGVLTKGILNGRFDIQEKFIIDNNLEQTNKKIKNLSYLKEIDCSKLTFLLVSDNDIYYDEIRSQIKEYVPLDNIVDILAKKRIGKYSYGELTKNCMMVESIGAFCSFASGAKVVDNHEVYISSHEFLSFPGEWEKHPGYIPGTKVKNKRIIPKSKIGNDVWLGTNVIITNGANIGNGVIAGAGAVITKDVPDYAVVAGVPAKIIRYRYTPEQIEKLNKIAWWNWSDEKLRQYYDDFYEDIETFIKKHDVETP